MRLQPRSIGLPSSKGLPGNLQAPKGCVSYSTCLRRQTHHHSHNLYLCHHYHHHIYHDHRNPHHNHNDHHQLDIGGNRAARDLSTELIDVARTTVRCHNHDDSDDDRDDDNDDDYDIDDDDYDNFF